MAKLKKENLNKVSDGHIILTPNDRLTHVHLNSYGIKHWLKSEYRKLEFTQYNKIHPILLNPAQIQAIWEILIAKNNTLLEHTGLIQELIEAWNYCKIFNLDWNLSEFNLTHQAKLFQTMANQFTNILSEKCFITESCLIPYLLKNNQSKQHITWFGFDTLNPQEQSLFDWHHSKQLGLDSTVACNNKYLIFNNLDAELHAINTWLIEKRPLHKKIAIIVPDLGKNVATIRRFFTRFNNINDFNFSIGAPLSQHPWVLNALDAIKKNIKIAEKNYLMSPHAWGELFINELNKIELIEGYYQKFINCIKTMQSLTIINSQFNFEQAWLKLQKILANTIFQNKHASVRNIHVLGMLEAAHQKFDGIWLMGLTNKVLPQAIKYNAFIPIKLAKDYMLPHTNHELQVFLGQNYLNNLSLQAAECVFSYSKIVADLPQNGSSLHAHIKYSEAPVIEPDKNAIALITMPYDLFRPIEPSQKLKISTSLIKNQNICAFKAFAANRLNLKKNFTVELGFDNAEKGQLIHAALAKLWQKFKTQQQLKNLNNHDLDQLLDQIIAETIYQHLQESHDNFHIAPIIINNEKQVLKTIINNIIAWDLNRDPFSIAAIEKTYTIPIDENSYLSIRIDRMDLIGDNLFVMDYKKNIPNPPWSQKSHIEDPQILIYSLIDDKVELIGFLKTATHTIEFTGAGTMPIPPYKITMFEQDAWDQAKLDWYAFIKNLVTEFRAGNITPLPKKSNFCDECEYRALCRYPLLRH